VVRFIFRLECAVELEETGRFDVLVSGGFAVRLVRNACASLVCFLQIWCRCDQFILVWLRCFRGQIGEECLRFAAFFWRFMMGWVGFWLPPFGGNLDWFIWGFDFPPLVTTTSNVCLF
jgi:hypothetical protein